MILNINKNKIKLVSDILALIFIFLWQPITEIVFYDFSTLKSIKYSFLCLFLFYLVLFCSTLPFMMVIDLLGLKNMVNLFIEKEEEKLKLYADKIFIDPVYKLCRHPMQAGFIGMFIFSSCNFNFGRVLFIILMNTGILIGVNEEEKHLREDDFYKKISKIVTNKFLPDFRNLFSKEFELLENSNSKVNKLK